MGDGDHFLWDVTSRKLEQQYLAKCVKEQYLDTESNSRLFFDTFFELCRKFNIQYSIATTQEKAFIDKLTEFMYERKKQK